MKKILSLVGLFCFGMSYSQCNPTTEKMMLLGDSWANFSAQGDSYNENLNRFGYSDIECYTTGTLSVNGTEASDWFTDASRRQELKDYIDSNPELEILHYSLGGNDIMRLWNKNMTIAQEDAIFFDLMTDIQENFDTIWSYNPNLKIHISGYDYANFSETVGTFAVPSLHPFYGTWDGMGQPNPEEINIMLQKATNIFIDSATVWNQVSFVNNLGLMQWHHGQLDNIAVPPGGQYAAGTAPVPGGFIDYPTPTEALQLLGLDAFHLNDDSYEIFIKRHFEEFYWDYYRRAEQTFTADNTNNNGWTTSSSQGTSNLKLGNDVTDESQAIISFNTFDFPDQKQATSASIFIQRTNLVGTNLQPEDLTVSIVVGNFGDQISIDVSDFADAGDATAVSCTYGTVDENGHWMRIDLDPSLLPFINRYGTTQFKLSYGSVTDNDRYFLFDNTIANIFLDVKLEDAPAGVSELNSVSSISLYPNPTTGSLTISNTSNLTQIYVTDMSGKLVKNVTSFNSNQLDLSELTSGIYMVQLIGIDGVKTQKIIKE